MSLFKTFVFLIGVFAYTQAVIDTIEVDDAVRTNYGDAGTNHVGTVFLTEGEDKKIYRLHPGAVVKNDNLIINYMVAIKQFVDSQVRGIVRDPIKKEAMKLNSFALPKGTLDNLKQQINNVLNYGVVVLPIPPGHGITPLEFAFPGKKNKDIAEMLENTDSFVVAEFVDKESETKATLKHVRLSGIKWEIENYFTVEHEMKIYKSTKEEMKSEIKLAEEKIKDEITKLAAQKMKSEIVKLAEEKMKSEIDKLKSKFESATVLLRNEAGVLEYAGTVVLIYANKADNAVVRFSVINDAFIKTNKLDIKN